MIHVFGDHHLRQQVGSGDAAIDHLRRHSLLTHALAAGTRPNTAHMALDPKGARHIIKPLRDILADALHGLATATGRIAGLMNNIYPGQLCGECLAHRLLFCRGSSQWSSQVGEVFLGSR